MDRTDESRLLKLMTVIDEHGWQCLAIDVARRIQADDVIDVFADLMATYGVPAHVRSDNGPEMAAHTLRRWLGRVGAKPLFITPGSPWEHGSCARPIRADSGS